MKFAISILFASRRKEIADAFADDPAAPRYAFTAVEPANAPARAGEFSLALVEVARAEDLAIGRKLRRENPSLEWLAVAPDDALGVEAVKAGANDYTLFPPKDRAELWGALGALLRRGGASDSSGIPSKIGRYAIVRRLGAGGMAEIFLADGPTAPVVVKCLLPGVADDVDHARMFLAEAQVSSMLEHPNIVRVIDFGNSNGRLFMAMDYIAGKNLEQIGRSVNWQLPLPVACQIVIEVCAGLEHAHSRTDPWGRPLSIVHRDVNPPNILLSDDGRVLLSDFGIAKTAHSHSHTTQGAVKGKLDYLSPEQVEGEPADRRSDVFSLGVVLYYFLTGIHPFRWGAPLKTMLRIRRAVFDPASTVNSAVPPELDKILARALARDRAERYPDAASFAGDLRAWMASTGARVTSEDLAALVRAPGSKPAEPVEPVETTAPAEPRLPVPTVPARPSSMATALRRDPSVPEWGGPGEDTITSSAPQPQTAGGEASVPERTLASVAEPSIPERTVGERSIAERTVVSPEPTITDAKKTPEVEAPLYADAQRESTKIARIQTEASRSTSLSRPVRPDTVLMVGVAVLAVSAGALIIRFGVMPGKRYTPPASPTATATPYTEVLEPTAEPSAAPFVAGTPTPRPRVSPRPATPSPPPTTATPRPTAVARVSRKGTLTIWVNGGWAAVSIDGRSLEQNAPIVGLELVEGKHRVLLENSAAKFRREYDVTVVAGEEARLGVTLPP